MQCKVGTKVSILEVAAPYSCCMAFPILARLNSLQQKVYRISLKICFFDDLFHKEGPVLVILVPGMIQPSGSGSLFEEIELLRL